tara:strand:+ start:523 stop:900 length:378 start_codon:yes stop_codon:yes gene_type:complete
MKYISLLLFVGLLFSQEKTYTFTEEQVLGFTNEIKRLEVKDSLNTIMISDLEKINVRLEDNSKTDSTLLSFKDLQIGLLNEEIELYKRKVKLVKPKWYENKWLYFGYGAFGVSTSVWLTGQLVGN